FGKREATGRLSFSWPKSCEGQPLNGADGALFPLGYGLSLGDRSKLGTLDESCGFIGSGAGADWYSNGRLAAGVTATADGGDLPNLRGMRGGVTARGFDKDRQEDARVITFAAGSRLTLAGKEAEGSQGAVMISYSIDKAPAGKVSFTMGGQTVDASQDLTLAEGKGWRDIVLTEACVDTAADRFTLSSAGAMEIKIASIARRAVPQGTKCSF
ncbi:MAG: putative glycoside hydrolase, partial [Pseudomonadota bacterium]